MSDGDDAAVELPQMWRFIHPTFNHPDSADDDDEDNSNHLSDTGADRPDEGRRPGRPADYVKLRKAAPRLGQLMRFLNDLEEDEEAQAVLLEKDPVTEQTLLQWAVLNDHFMLVEYLVKRLRRAAFAFDPELPDVVVFDRWIEMKDDLPNAAEVAERQKQRELERAKRLAERAMANHGDEDDEEAEEEEEEEENNEAMPEDVVYDSLEDYHEEWGERGVGIVKRIGELGVYIGSRLADGTKQGLGQSLFPSGDCYTGEYKENQREGRGVYWWAKASAIYIGEWFRNVRHGYGRMVYPDGSRYIGRWVNGKRSGVGRYVYKDGSSYDGSWLKDEKHGSGIYQLLDGSCFTGTFQHNHFVSGEWRLASGTVRYIGNFEKDIPVGAGAFVHRCGLKAGSFQQEGSYVKGAWVPSMLKGTSHVVPHIELTTQQSKTPRVPMEFGADCNCRTMADLIKVANFPPLLRWVAALPSPETDAEHGVTLKGVEVQALRYDDAGAMAEVTILPILVDRAGRRVHLPEETVTLKLPTTRLVVLLSALGNEEKQAVVLLEKSTQPASSDAGAQQLRLPLIRIGEDARVQGDVVHRLGHALRLQLDSTKSMALLMPPMRTNPMRTNAEESVWLYAQQVHPDMLAQIQSRLERTNADEERGSLTTYEVVALADVAQVSTDAITVMAATQVQQRRTAQTLPPATTAPQRPPTPPPPALEPRPELQPLYDAKARRDEAESEL
jgi:radial spoke head protein 1